jgi:hypothetical protein
MFLLRNYPSTRAGTSTLTGQSTRTGVSTPIDPGTRTDIRNVPYLMLCEVAAAVRAAGRPARIGLTRPVYRRPSCVLLYVLNIGWHAVAVW